MGVACRRAWDVLGGKSGTPQPQEWVPAPAVSVASEGRVSGGPGGSGMGLGRQHSGLCRVGVGASPGSSSLQSR